MKISLIIPYHNEEQNIIKTLNFVKAQLYQPDEILLINSSSLDRSSEIIDQFSKNNRELNIINLSPNTKNPSDSKNYGISKSKYDLLAFMDCGIVFPENWLSECLKCKDEINADIIFAPIKFNAKSTFDASLVAQLWGYKSTHFVIPGSLIKKNIFYKYGLFQNRRAGYDAVWKNKIKKNRVSIFQLKNVYIKYLNFNVASNFKSLFYKIFLYANQSAKLQGYNKDKIYILSCITFLILTIYNVKFGIFLTITYFLLRQFFFPIYKCKNLDLFVDYPLSFFYLFIVGLTIDIARLTGFLKSYFHTKV